MTNSRSPIKEKKMKPLRHMFPVVLMVLASAAFAQSGPETAAQKSFTVLKNLAGTWEGPVTLAPESPGMQGTDMQVSMRVTSRGNALVHEMREEGKPDDPARYDHPVTMFYLDSDHLMLTHYCDAGNRPRMEARASADGKTVEFDIVDVSGSTKHGHMDHAVFTLVDGDHHIEDWTYMLPGDKAMHAHFDLHRTK